MNLQELFYLFFLEKKVKVSDQNLLRKLWLVFKLFLALLITVYAINLLLVVLLEAFHDIESAESPHSKPEARSAPVFLLASLLVIVYEELSFRFWLGKFDRKPFLVAISMLIPLIVYKLLGIRNSVWLVDINQDIRPFVFLIPTALLVFAAMYHLVMVVLRERIALFGNKHIWKVVWWGTFLFAALHVEDPKLSAPGVLLIGIQFIPNFLLGLALVFVRMNVGFSYALLFHLMYNLPPMIIHVIR